MGSKELFVETRTVDVYSACANLKMDAEIKATLLIDRVCIVNF